MEGCDNHFCANDRLGLWRDLAEQQTTHHIQNVISSLVQAAIFRMA